MHCVGYWRETPLECNVLSPFRPIRATDWGPDSVKLRLTMRQANKRLEHMHEAAMGYAGWLVTHQLFLQEHNALLATWESEICQSALAGVARIVVAQGPAPFEPAAVSENSDLFRQAVRNFLVRWRLTDLVGPLLPMPMQPLMGGCFPISVLQQLMDAGGLFNIPDVFPIPSRDELREMLLDALQSADNADHLAEWHQIIHGRNVAKNQIDRYGRIRRLAHYWRLLHLRHQKALTRKSVRLHNAFAMYFGVATETIKADLLLINRRLGKGWELQPIPLMARP